MMTFNIVVVSCLLLLGLLVRRRNARRQAAVERIEVDDVGVRRTLVNGIVETVTWAELARVEVLTTDQGPYVEDLFFLLFARDGHGCAVRQDQSLPLLPRLHQLPGFDFAAFVTALGSTENARFVCWVAPENA
jgi:hypothetical protein